MCKICPQCGCVAEYNAYYGRVTCTKCSWESDIISREESEKYSRFEKDEYNSKKKHELIEV